MLNGYGVNYLNFSGGDQFHDQEAREKSFVRPSDALKTIREAFEVLMRKRSGFYLNLSDSSHYSRRVYPFGRARHLDSSEFDAHTRCQIIRDRAIAVSPYAQAYGCCFLRPNSLGSMTTLPLAEILEKNENHPLRLLGFEQAVRRFGRYDPADAEAYRTNPCSVCDKAFAGVSIDWSTVRSR